MGLRGSGGPGCHTWNTVIIAAGKVSKFAEGVPSLKLNLGGNSGQPWDACVIRSCIGNSSTKGGLQRWAKGRGTPRPRCQCTWGVTTLTHVSTPDVACGQEAVGLGVDEPGVHGQSPDPIWGAHHSPTPKQLHPQEGKDHDEKEEEEEQTDDGLHGAHQGDHKVAQGGPVPARPDSDRVLQGPGCPPTHFNFLGGRRQGSFERQGWAR